MDCKRFEMRSEGKVLSIVIQRRGGEGSLHQGWDGGGGRSPARWSPPLHLHTSDLCQNEFYNSDTTLGFYLPSEEDLLELNSFFVTWGFNLVRMRFLRKSQSSVEIIETFIRMRKRNTCNGSRSILWGSRLVTVVEYCYQNSNTVTTKRSGVTRHTSRPTVSLIRGSMNRNYIMALLLSFNTNPVQRSTVVVIYLDLYTRHCIVILIYIY